VFVFRTCVTVIDDLIIPNVNLRTKAGQAGITVSWYYRPEQVCSQKSFGCPLIVLWYRHFTLLRGGFGKGRCSKPVSVHEQFPFWR
jgi:hypothetical protein